MRNWAVYLEKNGTDQAWYLVGDGARTQVSDSASKELSKVIYGNGPVVITRVGQEAVSKHLLAIKAAAQPAV